MPKPKDVDAYIVAAPKEAQSNLKQLRAAIRQAAPGAEKRISYGMPYYAHKGRLAYLQLAKNHIGLYLAPSVIADHMNDLKAYETAKATIRFLLGNKLRVALIKKLIRSGVEKNEAKKGYSEPRTRI